MRRWSKDNINRQYWEWLYDKVDGDMTGTKDRHYNKLLTTLYEKPFRWSIPNDDNRDHEARELRFRFCEEKGMTQVKSYFPESATMLELLIILAYRCELIMDHQDGGLVMRDFFWMMLDNAALSRQDDDNFNRVKVDDILEIIIERAYDRSGKGGLFPLRHGNNDQRKTELWYQMNEYLVENYFSDID